MGKHRTCGKAQGNMRTCANTQGAHGKKLGHNHNSKTCLGVHPTQQLGYIPGSKMDKYCQSTCSWGYESILATQGPDGAQFLRKKCLKNFVNLQLHFSSIFVFSALWGLSWPILPEMRKIRGFMVSQGSHRHLQVSILLWRSMTWMMTGDSP